MSLVFNATAEMLENLLFDLIEKRGKYLPHVDG
jgi:hypothetical protein